MKTYIASMLAAIALLFTACTTVAPTTATPSDKIAAIATQTPGAVAAILTPVLQHNPKYATDVLLIGKTLPTLLMNGPINSASITSALGQIPNLTAQEKTDLAYIEIGLPLLLTGGQAITNKTVVLYTDPDMKVLVDAFCAGLVQAATAVLPQPNFAPSTIPVQPTPAGPTPTLLP